MNLSLNVSWHLNYQKCKLSHDGGLVKAAYDCGDHFLSTGTVLTLDNNGCLVPAAPAYSLGFWKAAFTAGIHPILIFIMLLRMATVPAFGRTGGELIHL